MSVIGECRSGGHWGEIHEVDGLCDVCFGGFAWRCLQRGILARRVISYPTEGYSIDVEDKQWRDFGRVVRRQVV